MKVAFIVGSFPRLSETFILNQIKGLIDENYQVDIYSIRKPSNEKAATHSIVEEYDLKSKTNYLGIPLNKVKRLLKALYLFFAFYKYIPLTVKSLNFFKYGKEAFSLRIFFLLISLIKNKPKGGYQIAHCHFGPMGFLGVALKDFGLVKKVITTFHGYDLHSFVKKHGNDVYKKMFPKTDLCTVNSDFTGGKIEELGCPKEKIRKLPVGLDVSKFPFKLREPNEKINILTIGRLVEKKGIEYSIKAVSLLFEEKQDINYKIIGDGPLKEKLEKLIKEKNMEKNIFLLGAKTQEEIVDIFNETHIFVLSSVTASDGDMEGQGLVLQEAQAMGLPIVSTYHNGIPEGVVEKKSAYLVPEKDEKELAKKIKLLIDHPEKWGDMGKAGRAFVEKNYDIKILTKKLDAIYCSMFE